VGKVKVDVEQGGKREENMTPTFSENTINKT
jgi:hypothetical protein